MPLDSLASDICPWLGLKRDPDTKHAYPSEGNACFASRNPRRLSLSHQKQYCLSIQFGTCPYFPQPVTEHQDTNKKISKVKAFFYLILTLFVIALLVLVIGYLGNANWFASGPLSIPSPSTPTSNAQAFSPDLTPEATVAVPTPSSTAIPSTATAVPTSIPTVAVPTPSPTAIASTATPVLPTATIAASPTKQPTVALRYPAAALLEPRNEQQINSETATFEWQVSTLQTGDRYELWLKHFGSPTWEKRYSVTGGKFVLSIRDAMDYGDYAWSILVLDALGQVASPIGEERKLVWRPRESPASESSSPFIKR